MVVGYAFFGIRQGKAQAADAIHVPELADA